MNPNWLQALKETSIKEKGIKVGKQFTEPLLPPIPLYTPTFLQAVQSVAASSSVTLISYRVPVDEGFETLTLDIEGESAAANLNCTFTVQIDGSAVRNVQAIRLDAYTIRKTSYFNLALTSSQNLEVLVRNNHATTAYTVTVLIAGRNRRNL